MTTKADSFTSSLVEGLSRSEAREVARRIDRIESRISELEEWVEFHDERLNNCDPRPRLAREAREAKKRSRKR